MKPLLAHTQLSIRLLNMIFHQFALKERPIALGLEEGGERRRT
jgi:hypothetical protein